MGHPKARKPAADRPARRLHRSAKAGELKRPEAYSIQYTCLSVYDDRTCIGHLLLRGKVSVEAFDANDRSLALLWQIFTHAAARQIAIFGSVGIAVEAVEPRAREWRDVRRAELAGAVGR